MTTKIDLTDLTDSDYKALLENDNVVDNLIDFTTDEASSIISDWLDNLDGVRNYSLSDSSQPNYMYISNSCDFLNSVLDVQKDYDLLTDTMAEKVKKVLSEYETLEPDSFSENELDEVGKQVADLLVNYAENEYDDSMESTSLLGAMKYNEALIFLYGDDAYYNREDNKIYYVCAD